MKSSRIRNLPGPRTLRQALLMPRPPLAVALLLALAAPSGGTHAQQQSRAALVEQLDSLAGAPVQEGRAVGIVVAVVRGTDTLLMRGYGHADLEFDVSTPDDAVYEIGSITKQFTAAAILQLRDEGKLDLDADFTTYLPDYPTGGRRIPLRRLLDHTSGIRSMTEIPSFRDIRTRRLPRDSAVAMIAAEPFDFEPGEAMIYNNSAYFLLGLIIEEVSGVSYEEYVEERIFAPLGMERSFYCSNTEVVERRAHGYQWNDQAGEWARASYVDHTWPYAAGSLCSTTGDMVRWLQALHGGEVLSERSYQEMTAPARLNDGTELRYGMGLALDADPRGPRMIGHGGSIPGYNSQASWYPEEELAVVVLFNSNGPVSPAALASELTAEIIPPIRPELRPFSGDAAPLVGTYRGPARGQEMTVEITRTEQGGLAGSVNGDGGPLPWVGDWTFRAGSTILIFKRDGDTGPATELRVDTGGGHYVLRRVGGGR